MNKKSLPEFETDRLFIRGVKLDDAESYEKNFANYDIIQHLTPQVHQISFHISLKIQKHHFMENL